MGANNYKYGNHAEFTRSVRQVYRVHNCTLVVHSSKTIIMITDVLRLQISAKEKHTLSGPLGTYLHFSHEFHVSKSEGNRTQFDFTGRICKELNFEIRNSKAISVVNSEGRSSISWNLT